VGSIMGDSYEHNRKSIIDLNMTAFINTCSHLSISEPTHHHHLCSQSLSIPIFPFHSSLQFRSKHSLHSSKITLSSTPITNYSSPLSSSTSNQGGTLILGGNSNLSTSLIHSFLTKSNTSPIHIISQNIINNRNVSNTPDSVLYYNVDLNSSDDIIDFIRNIQPSVIISCLSYSKDEKNSSEFDTNSYESTSIDYTGTIHAIEAAKSIGCVDRFVYVSRLGAGDSENTLPLAIKDSMRPQLLEQSRIEKALKLSGITYTIVRPGPIVVSNEEQNSSKPVLTESLFGYGTILDTDLCELITKIVNNKKTENKTFAALDKTKILLTSPYVRPLEFWEPLPFDDFVL